MHTNQRLAAALDESFERAKEALLLARSQPADVPAAFVQAFRSGAVLLKLAACLPDAQASLPPKTLLAALTDLAAGFESLGLNGPVLTDGQAFFGWAEHGKFLAPHGHTPPATVEHVLAWANTVREAFQWKYAERLPSEKAVR